MLSSTMIENFHTDWLIEIIYLDLNFSLFELLPAYFNSFY